MAGAPSSGGFFVQPTSLEEAARLLEAIAGDVERLGAGLSEAFRAASVGAGEPDLEHSLGVAALDFEEFARASTQVAAAEAHNVRRAAMAYVAADEDAAAAVVGLDLESTTASSGPEPSSVRAIGGPR
jgi:hypothetical protein